MLTELSQSQSIALASHPRRNGVALFAVEPANSRIVLRVQSVVIGSRTQSAGFRYLEAFHSTDYVMELTSRF